MGKLANYGKLGATDPDAAIKALFAAGEQGVWFDPSDLSTMFQDRAGTTPVTADGQTVGKILDKSGRGNHAVAPSDAARPLYKTDGTYHWLQFDGVDDSLGTSTVDLTSKEKLNIFIGVRVSGTTNQMPACFGNAGNGRADILYLAGASPVARATLVGGSGGVSQISTPTAGASPIKLVNTALFDISGATATDEIKIRQNGSTGTQTVISAGPAGTGNFGNYSFVLGDTNTVAPLFPFNGNIYSMIFRAVTSTTDEITNTETWVNQRTGAY